MKTLVWTRGEHMPFAHLHERLKCPGCGSRKISVWFEAPNRPRPTTPPNNKRRKSHGMMRDTRAYAERLRPLERN
jgi:hypothetical protein